MMGSLSGIVSRVLAVVVLATIPTFGSALTLSERAALQAEMQRHITEQLVDGVYLFLDTRKNEVRELHPVTAHTMILQMGNHYVLCYDFKDGAGKDVLVDYYVARRDGAYVVFHTAIANRALLYRLMEAGVVTKVRG